MVLWTHFARGPNFRNLNPVWFRLCRVRFNEEAQRYYTGGLREVTQRNCKTTAIGISGVVLSPTALH